jgi:hypothetical protein
MRRAASRIWRSGWLAAVLLAFQVLLLAHGVAHAFERGQDADRAEVCVECLALSGIQGAPPPAAPSHPTSQTTVDAAPCAVPPAPTFSRSVPFLSRAPPALRS